MCESHMKLSDLEEVKRTYELLCEAEGTIQKLKDNSPGRIVVTVCGVPIDELAEQVKPRAIQYLMVAVSRLHEKLVELGVDIDD